MQQASMNEASLSPISEKYFKGADNHSNLYLSLINIIQLIGGGLA